MQFFSTDKYLAQPISCAFYMRDVLVIKCFTLYIAANERDVGFVINVKKVANVNDDRVKTISITI